MKLKQTFFIAVLLGILSVTAWELYWRSQGLKPNLDDNKNLWANQREKLETNTDNSVVFIGSSRILYDIQLDIWREQTKTEPIMLAAQGSSPIPVFKDIIENTDFNGTLVVGVTHFLLFSTLSSKSDFISRPEFLVDYHKNRTYAQRINHKLSVPLQKNLAFIRDGDEAWDSDVDLKTLIKNSFEDKRAGPLYPPFNNFEEITEDRHMKMPEIMVTDTAYANTVKHVWKTLLSGDFPPPDKDGTMAAFEELSKKFKDRGGNLILVRCPSSGMFKDIESKAFPREEYWEPLVEKSGAKGYNYLDYEQFQNLFLPEWSHLATKDAQFFTKELIKLMESDGVLPKPKTN
jgi:hypothetical protein